MVQIIIDTSVNHETKIMWLYVPFVLSLYILLDCFRKCNTIFCYPTLNPWRDIKRLLKEKAISFVIYLSAMNKKELEGFSIEKKKFLWFYNIYGLINVGNNLPIGTIKCNKSFPNFSIYFLPHQLTFNSPLQFVTPWDMRYYMRLFSFYCL